MFAFRALNADRFVLAAALVFPWLRVPVCAGAAESPAPTATAAPTPAPEAPAAEPTAVEQIRQQARALAPLMRTDAVQAFLAATADLPHVAPRTIYRNKAAHLAYTADEAEQLPEAERAACTPRAFDESFYYFTAYGTPLIYARPLEIYADVAGRESFAGCRVFDFGYGGVGHLRLLAANGADAVGVDVEPVFRALYSQPGDKGTIAGRGGAAGKITLLHGQFPADAAVTAAAGDGYDLFLSKNVLKRGYIHPEREAPPELLVHLGADDAAFVGAVWDMLKPGGYVLVYNICPAQAPPDKPYIPWADGRFPFARGLVEGAGFEVLAWNVDDFPALYDIWAAVGYDEGKSLREHSRDLFAHYTLLRKPLKAGAQK
ncbi:MAG TPA: hypothetical protein P5572_12620 [Phycisphaerae bacterium]|nr:hypothetical protein [Phycisphaerae bacterium]